MVIRNVVDLKGHMAQWIAHPPPERKVAGSTPALLAFVTLFIFYFLGVFRIFAILVKEVHPFAFLRVYFSNFFGLIIKVSVPQSN